MILVFLDEFFAAVCRTTVDDNPFEVAPGLADDGVDGALETVAVVVVDGDDG